MIRKTLYIKSNMKEKKEKNKKNKTYNSLKRYSNPLNKRRILMGIRC